MRNFTIYQKALTAILPTASPRESQFVLTKEIYFDGVLPIYTLSRQRNDAS